MIRILCARFPHLGLVAAWRRHQELRDEPVVLTCSEASTPQQCVGGLGPTASSGAQQSGGPGPGAIFRRAGQTVVAASEAARAAGVRPGQPLRQARQLSPGAALLPLDAAAVDGLRSALLTTLCALAPAVELGDEEAWCDLSGRHAAHRDELAWAAAVARGLADSLAGGVVPAVGVASTRHVASVAARLASPGRVRRVRSGEEAAVLAALPVGMLPADPAILARLGDLGLDRVGQVAALSPADLQRQFGPAGVALLRLARGEVEESLDPYRRPLVMAERIVLDGPVTDLEVLRRCAERATAALGDHLLTRGLAATRVELAMEPETAEAGITAWSAWRVPPVPAGSAADLWPAVLGLLGSVHPTGPVAALRVLAAGLGQAPGRQTDLWRRGDAARDAVAITVARLRDRFGAATVLHPRLALDPGDCPERRFAWDLDHGRDKPGGQEVHAASPVPLVPMACPPTGTPPLPARSVRAGRHHDWRDEGPVSRVRRERPAADGSRVDRLAQRAMRQSVGATLPPGS